MVSIQGCQRSFKTYKMSIIYVLKGDLLDGLQTGKQGVKFSTQTKWGSICGKNRSCLEHSLYKKFHGDELRRRVGQHIECSNGNIEGDFVENLQPLKVFKVRSNRIRNWFQKFNSDSYVVDVLEFARDLSQINQGNSWFHSYRKLQLQETVITIPTRENLECGGGNGEKMMDLKMYTGKNI